MEGDVTPVVGDSGRWCRCGDVDVSVLKRSSVSLVEWNQTEKERNYWESLSCATGCDASPILVQQ
jgi:hypothetical protein